MIGPLITWGKKAIQLTSEIPEDSGLYPDGSNFTFSLMANDNREIYSRLSVLEANLNTLRLDLVESKRERDEFYRENRAASAEINRHLSKTDKFIWMAAGGLAVMELFARPAIEAWIHK